LRSSNHLKCLARSLKLASLLPNPPLVLSPSPTFPQVPPLPLFFPSHFFPLGNLYTWGNTSLGLGYEIPKTQTKTEIPRRIDGFNNNVVKVSMGGSHSAVITSKFSQLASRY